MRRPPLEVADLIRSAGAAFIERNRQWLRWKHVKVLLAIARCRTAALGGHLDECTHCGHRAAISYNSCRNRHCPKCQIATRDRWITARQRSFSRPATFMWSLPCPRNWPLWHFRTRSSSIACCYAPVRKPFSKSLAIPDTWARKLVSSAYCTPGIKGSVCTRMPIASFLLAG